VMPFVLTVALLGEQLPIEWSQSYCTYDIARVHAPGSYSFGFGVDNFTLYDAERDTIPYDTRRFDLFATLGILKRTEVEDWGKKAYDK